MYCCILFISNDRICYYKETGPYIRKALQNKYSILKLLNLGPCINPKKFLNIDVC